MVDVRGEQGFTFIETLIGVVVFGLIGLAVLTGLTITARSNIISNEHTTAESLARTQMEYVQKQPYDSVHDPPEYGVISYIPTSYSILTPMATRLDPVGDGTANDDGFQQITVCVLRNGKTLFTLEDFKVLR